ncbi:MAG: hypothetical protein AAF950_12970 [Pseudomonadota bacterium]
MSAQPETPMADDDDLPVVKVAYQTYAETPQRSVSVPSITSNTLLTALKALTVAALMLIYPVLVVTHHQVDDSPIDLADASRHWTVPEAGIASQLITRELDGPGWVADRHLWHPQSRLTALPAWQDTLVAAISDHGRLSLSMIEGQRDPDLEAAIRSLGRTTTEDAIPRLVTAREALTRYDGRVGAGLSSRPQGALALAAELELFAEWATANRFALGEIASPGDGWIASEAAIETVYRGKARAHVAHEMINARLAAEPGIFPSSEAELAVLQALEKWRIAAKLRPLFISNHGADALIGANHPAMMAFLISDAGEASKRAATLLKIPSEPEVEPEGETAANG